MDNDSIKAFITATGVLPEKIWRALYSVPLEDREKCEEIRIRSGRPVLIKTDVKIYPLTFNGTVIFAEEKDIEETVLKASSYSVHTYEGQINNGFITMRQGHRIGVCGEMTNDGKGALFKPASLNLRIAKPVRGIAEKLFSGGFENTLIISAPGDGKTTLLRDAVRYLSKGRSVSVADDRYEIAGVNAGKCTFDVGDCDVMSGGSKYKAVMNLLRSMSPDIIATDEITDEKDLNALMSAFNCGCGLIATMHGEINGFLTMKKAFAEKALGDVFKRIISITKSNGLREYSLYKREEEDVKGSWSRDGDRLVFGNWIYNKKISIRP